MIRREVLLSHSEAVASLGVHVQFGRFVSVGPLLIQSDAVRCESEIVISGSGDKHRRRIHGNRRIFEPARGSIDHGYKGGPAIRRVMEGDSSSDRPTGGESD